MRCLSLIKLEQRPITVGSDPLRQKRVDFGQQSAGKYPADRPHAHNVGRRCGPKCRLAGQDSLRY